MCLKCCSVKPDLISKVKIIVTQFVKYLAIKIFDVKLLTCICLICLTQILKHQKAYYY